MSNISDEDEVDFVACFAFLNGYVNGVLLIILLRFCSSSAEWAFDFYTFSKSSSGLIDKLSWSTI